MKLIVKLCPKGENSSPKNNCHNCSENWNQRMHCYWNLCRSQTDALEQQELTSKYAADIAQSRPQVLQLYQKTPSILKWITARNSVRILEKQINSLDGSHVLVLTQSTQGQEARGPHPGRAGRSSACKRQWFQQGPQIQGNDNRVRATVS